MKKKIIYSLFAVVLVSTQTSMAEEANESGMDYRRNSLYSLMVNHTDQKYSNEIKNAFLDIETSDKFNDHDLSVKVVNINKK